MSEESHSSESNESTPFSLEDISFIHQVFHMDLVTLEDLAFIMAKPKLRQPLLDSRRLFEACRTFQDLDVSPYLYYYVQIRQVLLRSGIVDLDLASHMTGVALDLARSEASHFIARNLPFDPYQDIALSVFCRDVEDRRDILIQVELGSYRVLVDGTAYREQPSDKYSDHHA